MTEKEFKEYLNSIHKFINVAKGAINKESKEVQGFINFYSKLTGKKVGEGSCKDCILDAYFELSTKTPNQLKILLMEKKYVLKKNKVVGFGGSHYTNDNITDEVAFKMITQSRSNAGHFENGEQLLNDFDAAAHFTAPQEVKIFIQNVPIEKQLEQLGIREKKEQTVTDHVKDAKIEVKITEKKKTGRPKKK